MMTTAVAPATKTRRARLKTLARRRYTRFPFAVGPALFIPQRRSRVFSLLLFSRRVRNNFESHDGYEQ